MTATTGSRILLLVVVPVTLLLHCTIVVESYFQQQPRTRITNKNPIQKLTIPFVQEQESIVDNDSILEQQQQQKSSITTSSSTSNRRAVLHGLSSSFIAFGLFNNNQLLSPVFAVEENEKTRLPDTFDVDSYLRSGFVTNPMGVSGQAGKSRPETGIRLREGSEVSRDSRTGNVLAEILVSSSNQQSASTTTTATKIPVVASFVSPWPLATGSVFDVECRNANTGDGTFLAVTENTNGKILSELPDTFFLQSLISPTSRFSFYGTPTDIKIKKSIYSDNNTKNYKIIDFSFSTLSQSTQTEIPRRARVIATIPDGTSQAVMLIGSSSATRWKKGSEETIEQVITSFRAIPAPTTNLRIRAKEVRRG